MDKESVIEWTKNIEEELQEEKINIAFIERLCERIREEVKGENK